MAIDQPRVVRKDHTKDIDLSWANITAGWRNRMEEFAHRDLAGKCCLIGNSKSGSLPDREAKLMIVSRSAHGRPVSLASFETWCEK